MELLDKVIKLREDLDYYFKLAAQIPVTPGSDVKMAILMSSALDMVDRSLEGMLKDGPEPVQTGTTDGAKDDQPAVSKADEPMWVVPGSKVVN